MDFAAFFKTAMVGAVPLVFVIIGLVELSKRLGAKGKPLLIVSMLIGILLGVPYQMTQQRPPGGSDWFPIFVYWFATIVYAIAMGLVASGLYDMIKERFEKLISAVVKRE